MFFLLALTASVQEECCFYKNEQTLCPNNAKKFVISHEGYEQFQLFINNLVKTTPHSFVFYFVDDMEYGSQHFAILPQNFKNYEHNFSFIGIRKVKPKIHVDLGVNIMFNSGFKWIFNNVHVVPAQGASFACKYISLESTTFEKYSLLKADFEIEADFSSIAPFGSYTSKSIVISLKEFPSVDTHVILDSTVENKKFIIHNIVEKANMTLFGNEVVLGSENFTGKAFFDFSASSQAPTILIDEDDTNFDVFCEFYTPRDYLPLYNVNITSNSIVTAQDSFWPSDLGPNGLISFSCVKSYNAYLKLNCKKCPFDINIRGLSQTYEANTLNVVVGKNDANLTGTLYSENLNLFFTTISEKEVKLTIDNIYEYGTPFSWGGVYYATGIWAKNESPNLLVYIKEITKIDSLNASSTYSGTGKWQFEDFPTTSGGTAVSNLVIDSNKIYHINYNYVNASGPLAAPFACSGEGSGTNFLFTDSTTRKFKIMPIIFDGDDLPNYSVLNDRTVFGQYYFYMNVLKTTDVEYDIIYPEKGPSGFQKSTMLFDFVRQKDDIIMNQRGKKTIFNFTYKFSISPNEEDCIPDTAYFNDTESFDQGVDNYLEKKYVSQLEFYLFEDFTFNYDSYPLNSIDVKFIGDDVSNPRKVTVDYSFFTSEKFSYIFAKNVQFIFNESLNSKIELLPTLELDDASFSQDIISHLDCSKTELLLADPESYDDIQSKCIPNKIIFKNAKFDAIELGHNNIKFINQSNKTSQDISLNINEERPYVEINCDSTSLKLIANNPNIPQVVDLVMTTTGHTIEIEKGFPDKMINSNLIISNINGVVRTQSKTLPFVPNNTIKIDIQSTNLKEINIQFPFDVNTLVTTQSGVHIVYKDITFSEPFNRNTKDFLESVKLDGNITFSNASGIRIIDFDFYQNHSTTIEINYRLEKLPYIELNSLAEQTKVPKLIKMVHYGDNETGQIKRLPDYFDDFHYDLLCGDKINCTNWEIEFKTDQIHYSGNTSFLGLTCRTNPKTNKGMCLTLGLLYRPDLPNDNQNNDKAGGKSPLSTGVIIGISVACVAIVVMIVIITVIVTKRKGGNLNSLSDLEALSREELH